MASNENNALIAVLVAEGLKATLGMISVWASQQGLTQAQIDEQFKVALQAVQDRDPDKVTP